mmetsp:Transcript_9333/g.18948  ORF Transcript_9333/g.18948 Transcript_9333/m.18948 type:complete len:245 (+) Transcript_9333:249-983(+)
MPSRMSATRTIAPIAGRARTLGARGRSTSGLASWRAARCASSARFCPRRSSARSARTVTAAIVRRTLIGTGRSTGTPSGESKNPLSPIRSTVTTVSSGWAQSSASSARRCCAIAATSLSTPPSAQSASSLPAALRPTPTKYPAPYAGSPPTPFASSAATFTAASSGWVTRGAFGRPTLRGTGRSIGACPIRSWKIGLNMRRRNKGRLGRRMRRGWQRCRGRRRRGSSSKGTLWRRQKLARGSWS